MPVFLPSPQFCCINIFCLIYSLQLQKTTPWTKQLHTWQMMVYPTLKEMISQTDLHLVILSSKTHVLKIKCLSISKFDYLFLSV